MNKKERVNTNKKRRMKLNTNGTDVNTSTK